LVKIKLNLFFFWIFKLKLNLLDELDFLLSKNFSLFNLFLHFILHIHKIFLFILFRIVFNKSLLFLIFQNPNLKLSIVLLSLKQLFFKFVVFIQYLDLVLQLFIFLILFQLLTYLIFQEQNVLMFLFNAQIINFLPAKDSLLFVAFLRGLLHRLIDFTVINIWSFFFESELLPFVQEIVFCRIFIPRKNLFINSLNLIFLI
jgi:hypothetical protein